MYTRSIICHRFLDSVWGIGLDSKNNYCIIAKPRSYTESYLGSFLWFQGLFVTYVICIA